MDDIESPVHLEKKLEAQKYNRRGLYPQALTLALCIIWWTWRAPDYPPPGESIAILAFAAVFITVRADKFGVVERAIWVAIGGLLLFGEATAIKQDRMDSALKQQIADADRERKYEKTMGEFSHVLGGVTETIALGKEQSGSMNRQTAMMRVIASTLSHGGTTKQAFVDTVRQSSEPTVHPLTSSQVELISVSATYLAKQLRDEFAVDYKAFQDRNKAIEQQVIDEWVERGKTEAEARSIASSMHTGGQQTSIDQDIRSMAFAVAGRHHQQIQSIIDALKSDPSRYQGNLVKKVGSLQSNCDVPDSNVDYCSSALETIASAVK